MLTENEFAKTIIALGGQAYIVGGWVRDRLLGREAHDKDYVVCGLNRKILENAFQVAQTGHQFPVYLINIDGETREVALARTERKSGTGYHGFTVEFTPETTITEDLYRRDTRMNSMAMSLPEMTLIDPFNGQADIRDKIIHATSYHFCEDPVRALRTARQAAQLGFSVSEETLRLMQMCKNELLAEPGERIFQEMRKALAATQPKIFFSTLRCAGLLDSVFPELSALCGVPQPVQYHHGFDAFDHTMNVLERTSQLTDNEITRFAALVHDLGKGLTPAEEWPHHFDHPQLGLEALESISKRIPLPGNWYKYARFIIARHMDIPRLKKAGKIVEILLEMQRNQFSVHETAAITTADHEHTPSWLVRGDELISFLTEKRKHIVFPVSLPLVERGTWVKMQLAHSLAEIGKWH